MRFQKCLIVISLGLLYTLNSYGWGNLGHRAIARVAENHLCPQTQQATQRILKGESLVEASTWADEIRSEERYDYLKPFHYVLIEKGQTYASSPKNPHGDVVVGIQNQIKILKDKTVREDARNTALKLLIHFVADAHQPMHSGFKNTRGGNTHAIDWFGKITNLHAVWDTGILDKTDLSFSEIAEFIDRSSHPGWNVSQKSAPLWVEESSRFNDAIETDYSGLKKDGDPLIPLKLPLAYYDQNLPLIKKRLLEAGLRLANTLNETFGCN